MNRDEQNETPFMEREECLATWSLLLDGRFVDPAVELAAREYRQAHPEVDAIVSDWEVLGHVLSEEPEHVSEGDITEGVLERVRERNAVPVMASLRQLAVAAGLALLVTVGYGLGSPGSMAADVSQEEQSHAVDAFKTTPWQLDQIDDGIRTLFPKPMDLSPEEEDLDQGGEGR